MPAGHSAHDAWPCRCVCLPLGQLVHTLLSEREYIPAAHESHDDELVALVMRPAGHALH